jgi:hypothetical protein
LELFTLGVIFCAFLMYAFWWRKPFDTRRPIELELKAPFPPSAKHAVVDKVTLMGLNGKLLWSRNVGIFVCLGFGSFHLIGWSFYFPTQTER